MAFGLHSRFFAPLLLAATLTTTGICAPQAATGSTSQATAASAAAKSTALAGGSASSASDKRVGSASAAEARTERYFDSVRGDHGALVAFLREMPKGGDLHNHLSGAIYAESLIKWAAERGECIDSHSFKVSSPPCGGEKNTQPISDAFNNQVLYRSIIDAWSMRNWQFSGQSGHDHFFDTFDKFNAASHGSDGRMLAETANRAASQHEIYQELMATSTGPAFADAVKAAGWSDDFATQRQALLDHNFRAAVAESLTMLSNDEKERDAELHCGTPQAEPGCTMKQRFIFQVLRGLPKQIVFAQILLGFEMASADPRVVGLNLVMPEDYYVPMHDFPLHMRMVEYLHGVYPKVHIALHAGELSPGLVTPEGLSFHVRDSVEIGHAERISHGVDVMGEINAEQLLREMAERNVMVEICLTSNDVILGIGGKQHPLHDYMRAGVPVALATDDEGVARSDMTQEFLRGVEEQELDYRQLKRMARTGLEHAFLPGPSLWRDPKTFLPVKECAVELGAKLAISSCQKFLDSSEKAQMQWKLEQQFREFEAKPWAVEKQATR